MKAARSLTIGFAIPGDLSTPTGGYRYDRMVMDGLGEFGIKVIHIPMSAQYPTPDPATRQATARLINNAAVDLWLVDGLAFGAFDPVELSALKGPVIALVHHALCDETGLDQAVAGAFRETEKKALAFTEAVIVTSEQTSERICHLFGLEAAKVHVAVPGVMMPVLPDDRPSPTLRLLCVGSISQRKGYDLLIAALAPLQGQAWKLGIAGRLDDQDATRHLRQLIDNNGLAEQITLYGPLMDEELESMWARHDALLFPSRYEGYGMVLTEALAHGLPVLCSDQVPAAEGMPAPAVLQLGVEDRQEWTRQISRWLEMPELVSTAKHSARKTARLLPQWRDTTAKIANIIDSAYVSWHNPMIKAPNG